MRQVLARVFKGEKLKATNFICKQQLAYIIATTD